MGVNQFFFFRHRGISATVNAHQFAQVVEARLAEIDKSAITALRGTKLPRDAIRSVFRGHEPKLSRAAQIAHALNLEFYIGPPRGEPKSRFQGPQILGVQKERTPYVVAQEPPRALESGLERVRDPDLAELLAAVVARWRALPEAERRYLLADLWTAGGSGLRAQGSKARSPGSDGG